MGNPARDLFDAEIVPRFEASKAKPWIEQAREIARYLWAKEGQPLSVDDIRAVLPPPSGTDPRIMGCLFRKPEWRAVQFVNSERKTCHGRPLRRFVRVGQ